MNFFRDNKNTILLICATIILIITMAVSGSGKPNAGIVSNTVGIVFKPLQKGMTYITNCFKYGADAEKFAAENTLLKEQLIVANQKAGDYDNLAAENQKLRAMLELSKNTTEYKLKAAGVIGYSTQNWSSAIKIDKGISDGIKKNDAVITESGLVGFVSEVGRNWANVTTILDSTVSVGAIVSRIDEHCMVQGDEALFDNGFCAIKYLTTDSAVSVGDIATTSGSGGVYPRGIIIGKINKITPNSNGLSLDAVIEPAVDVAQVQEVFVIID